jgi:hypothetical protein
MSHATGKLVVHHRSEGVAMGTLDGFFVMRCFGVVSPGDIRATLKCGDLLKAYRPEGSVSIVAVDPTSTFPSEETRRVALDVTRQTSAQTLALAVIVMGDGFWASAIRGVLTTLASLGQTNHPRKVARQEEEGVEWAIEAIGESPQKYRAPLLAALAQLKPATMPAETSSKPAPPISNAPAATSKPPAPSSKSPQAGSGAPSPSSKAPDTTSKVPPSSKRRSG